MTIKWISSFYIWLRYDPANIQQAAYDAYDVIPFPSSHSQ
jgi:hypothetical protein